MKNIQEQQAHESHSHDHSHDHDHGKMPIISYFIGLVLAIIGLFLSDANLLIQNILFSIATITAGYHVIILEGIGETVENTKLKGKFTPNSHILMGLAAIGASLIGSFWEGTLLILIFSGAHFLEDYAEGKSKREITKLLEMNPTTAKLILPDGNTKIVDVSELKVGDQLQVLNGDQVPIDGIILSGTTSIDESSINGESIPKEKSKGDEVFGSTINGTGTFTMEVTKENKDTVFSKILQLVSQNQDNQTKAASIIQKFEPKYVNIVLIAIPLVMLLAPFLFDWTWSQSVYRGLVLLVAASPCALAAATVSVTLSTTSNLAKKGVLSKGSTYLSQLADIDAIAFDKTGTLTNGEPKVTNYYFTHSVNEEVIGIIALMDIPNEHAKETINYFKKLGIHTTLITGDSEMTGKAVGEQLGIDEVIANVMPEDKSRIIEEQKEKFGVTAMVGDGVNDAPALVNADVGIAMGGGTDVAVEVSDLVLMQNNLSKLVQSHKISSNMGRVIRQNIIFSMAVVAFLVVISLLGLTDITISVIVHEGSTLVVILNGLRLLRSK